MRELIVLTALIVMLPSASWAAGKKIQCWTDDKGNRSCGDSVPPQYASKERQVLNEHGLVIDTKARQKTAEEIAEEERKKVEDAAAQKKAKERAANDGFLLDTYSSTKELEKTRDVRVQTLDSSIQLAESALKGNEQTLADLRGRATSTKPVAGADPKKLAQYNKLLKQIAAFEQTLADNTKAVEVMKQQRAQTTTKFNEDIQRWQELKTPKAATP